ncbi:MAG: phosphoribosylformylglycinamidine synthase subunit PurL, partial [Acidimicrobiia bacterium]|nr:phosphoribosylformylglycinamidine synthase subunit PurL [Acidimicrobiia bacterium]
PPPGETSPQTTTEIDSILATHLRAATEEIDRPWVRSAFVDDAGIVALDDEYDLAFKVETHNHPSALEPFGGANTGVGGVVRDVIGVSARPIANTNILCFGPQDLPFEHLPEGVLHPRRISAGVIAGIEDYGNKMGIPTVNGAILYDPGYTANPLVFCGCLGILPNGSHPTEPRSGDQVVVLGGRTGRDGLRGATFSSMETDHQTSEVAGSAVQIGHPIHEKQVMEAIVLARDSGLYNAITDCGAGGLSSSVGEMAEVLGAEVHLDRVPLKYPGLAPWEIWLSEAQERMVIAVPPTKLDSVANICNALDVEMTVLGEFTGDGRMHILHNGTTVGDIDCDFLHNGIPQLHLIAEWAPSEPDDAPLSPIDDPTGALLEILALPNIRSKEDVVRRYDHEVQGGTIVKPFVGPDQNGPADAAVVAPLESHRTSRFGSKPGAALSVGVNPSYGPIDPYLMAWAAVDEAVRNVVAVGADPDRVSILDNFSWGNPRLPDRLGALVRCTQGCHDAAVAYRTPFISGKDSLNNEYTGEDGKKHTIPGTLVISALGIVPDIATTVTSDLKTPGSAIFAIGVTGSELGGSALATVAGARGGAGPQPPAGALDGYRRLHQAIRTGIVAACHDASEGGWAVAAAEMAIGGGIGMNLDLGTIPRTADAIDDATIAFSESLGRLLVEVGSEHRDEFLEIMSGYPTRAVGTVRSDQLLEITGMDGSQYITTDVAGIAEAWRGHLGGAR